MSKDVRVRLSGVIPVSRVNGPGLRSVVFFQGCTRGCPGCFNTETHARSGGYEAAAGDLIAGLWREGLEGITVSGGEPFDQPEALFTVLLSARDAGLSTVVYTGFRLEELAGEAQRRCLGLIDVLVDGPFVESAREGSLLARGSTNQRFHFLTDRYGPSDMVLPARAEVIVAPDGTVSGTGFSRIEIPLKTAV